MRYDLDSDAGRAEPPFVARLGKRVEGIVSRYRGRERPRQESAAEDLWDPAGVPGPLEIVLPSPARRLQYWFRAAGRR